MNKLHNFQALIASIAVLLVFHGCKTIKDTAVVKEPMETTAKTLQKEETMSLIEATAKNYNAPTARKEATKLEMHGDTRIDNYYWMKLSDEQKMAEKPDAVTSEVVKYLEDENEYLNNVLAPLSGHREKLFDEIVGRIKQTDISVPYKSNGYFYITRYEEGQEYPIHSRKKENLEAKEEIMLNVNDLAADYDYFAVGGMGVSTNNEILAYGEDTLSRRIYKIKFKNLKTGEYYSDELENTTGGVTWANDNKTVFYTRKDDALRSYQIFRHTLGTDQSEDVLIFHEKDETFGCFVYKTKSKKYIVVGSYATLSNEYSTIPADKPMEKMTMFQKREHELEYSISHFEDKWYVLTNKDKAENFKLMVTKEGDTRKESWKEFIPHRADVLLEYTEIFKDNLVLAEREDGLRKLKIMPWDKSEPHFIDFGESVYHTWTSINPDFDTDILRLGYTSLTTPNSTYDYSMTNRKLELLKQQEVVGGYDGTQYKSERIMVEARDGVKVPMSIVYKNDFKKDGTQPVLLYGYGSYGSSMNPYFSSVRLSLLDRGFAFAIAHIRGGQEMGRQWYENGKFLHKKNTFNDFVDCGKFLVNNKYAAKDHLYAKGGSAGGLLMGAIMNSDPSLWKAVISNVPFVDVVTTMLDETIPLTTGEYDEWGNPNDKVYYDYIKTYSPYDNVEAKDYPTTLVTTGYFDSQVQYWEPAKWVAKLRELKTDDNPLLFLTEMETGHGGQSGRFKRYKEVALEYAFLLDLAGKLDK